MRRLRGFSRGWEADGEGGGEARVHVAVCVGVGDEAVGGGGLCVFGLWGFSNWKWD